ncbi:MAG TPA: 2-oxoglutarate dehydrogenase complex dihydrolipoyllysine-residue succinyltransferase [Gammaproteobacteria bacterium]|nr:2-oxoglutarate dehydrogenase complex dihydrolipoyllysine-residue succinyltransferase [Gammaproteobacteria bacterium]
MSIEVKVPQLPESVADATLITWHKKAGDAVRREENLVDLETDKVVLEVPAPVDGVIREIVASDGAVVTSGQLLAILEPGAAAAAAPPASAAKDKAPPAAAKAVLPPKAAPTTPAAPTTRAAPAAAAAQARSSASANRMGPAVRKLVEEHDLDPGAIAGSGREGRITKGDVLDYMADHQATTVGIEHDVLSQAGVRKEPTPQPTAPGVSRNEHRVAMTRLRARIAERLLQAQQQAAMLTTFNEVDMTAVMALRQRYQEPFTAKHGIKLGFMSFFVKASVEALRQFPVLNASVDGNDVIYHEFFDLGVAVSTDRGLVVPVLRNAEGMGFGVIEQTIRDFGERARKGSLQMEELTGGTFTITNGGIFGSLMSTPILNPPQSGILGMHKIQERPMVVGGKIEARPMMYLALTYDHRIVDGRDAVQFLVHVKDLLEDPARLLLEI